MDRKLGESVRGSFELSCSLKKVQEGGEAAKVSWAGGLLLSPRWGEKGSFSNSGRENSGEFKTRLAGGDKNPKGFPKGPERFLGGLARQEVQRGKMVNPFFGREGRTAIVPRLWFLTVRGRSVGTTFQER